MIFVTVGTHEQPFNRLIEAVDKLKGDGAIQEEVVVQRGYSTYAPQYCTSFSMLPYEEMQRYNREARIVITHGGPASFLDVLALGKVPIVVPRQKQYGEHVNDHQLEFCLEVEKRLHNIIVVEDVDRLGEVIKEYQHLSTSCNQNMALGSTKGFTEVMLQEIKKLF